MSDCVGCGFCCTKAKCAAAQRLYPAADRCPALKWDDGQSRYVCDLMMIPVGVGAEYRKELYANTGCSSAMFNEWRQNVRNRDDYKDPNKGIRLSSDLRTFLHCLGREMVSGDVLYMTCNNWYKKLLNEGNTEREAKIKADLAMHYMKEERSKQTKEFMG